MSLDTVNLSNLPTDHSAYLEVFMKDQSDYEYGRNRTVSWLHIVDVYPFPKLMRHREFIIIRDYLLSDNKLIV